MIEIFVAFILMGFFGLFVMMAVPMKDRAAKLNQQMEQKQNTSKWQQS